MRPYGQWYNWLLEITVDGVKVAADNGDRKTASVNQKHAKIKKQESPAIADKPARRLRKVFTVYVRAVGLL